MKFSQSLDLALHALWYMAKNHQGKPFLIKDLALSTHSSESYLARIMLNLVKAGLLKSIRGKRGGVVFKKPPDQITVADVVIIIDKEAGQYRCSWEERGCDVFNDCMLIELFKEAQYQMLTVLRKKTITDIANSTNLDMSQSWLSPVTPVKMKKKEHTPEEHIAL